nr:hypothetical protein [Tanacetum cinerariifolium]
MEAGGKDRPPMLAPGNYVQWKSKIKRYIDTKPNHELIHYCLKNPPYKFTWADKEVPISEGSLVTRTETYMETYKNVLQDIRDQLNAEAEEVQIILTGIDNDIYSTIDACPNAFNVQFLLQLQPEWQRFVTLVKQSQELKTVSYHKLYDILKQHQNEVNEIRAKRIARAANPLTLVAQQQPVYHPQNHPTHYTQNSSTRSQQAATRNKGKAIINSPQPIYDQESSMVAEDDETSKDKEIDKLVALISLSFKKIYKPTNNNLRTSSNTRRENQDNSPRINRGVGYENQRIGNVAEARETVGTTVVQKSRIQCYNCKVFGHVAKECQKPKRVKDATYHIEKMLLCKQEEAGIQLNAEQADWRDDADDELEDQELEAHYIKHPEQSESVHETYPIEQEEHNVIIDSLDMSYDREQIDQNDDDNDLANERELLASLIEKLKCEIDDIKITNTLMYNDFKKSQAELKKRNNVEYASKVEIDCTKAKGDLISYKMESQKSFNKYTQTINDLNQTTSKMKEKLCAHKETISILSQQKEAQIKLYKTRKDKELDKVIALENKVKFLDNIVYKIGQSVQTMNMLNNKCRTSFVKPEFLKKAQRANPRPYDIGCYNDNLALMLALESDEVIRLEKESRSKLSDLIRPFNYDKLNNLYDLFVPQHEKSFEQRYFSERSRLCHTPVTNGNSKESFNKQTTLLEKWMDESILWDQKCKSSIELFKIKSSVGTIFNGVEHEVTNLQFDYLELLQKCECLEKELSKSKMMSKSFESKDFCKEREQYFEIQDLKAQLQDKVIAIIVLKKLIEKLKGKYVDTKFEKSSVIRQPNAFKSQRPLILGKPTTFSNSFIRKDFSKSTSVTKNNVSNDFSKPVTAQTLPSTKKHCLKNTNVLTPGMYKIRTAHTQATTSKLPQDSKKTNKSATFSTEVIPTTSVSRPQLKSNPKGDRVLHSNSHGKKLEVEEHLRNVKLSKNKMPVTACTANLNAKTVNIKSISAMCVKCVMTNKHDVCVTKSVAKPLRKPVASESIKKPRNNVRKLNERFGKINKWTYIKFTPLGYMWKPKSKQANVNQNVSMPLTNASRTANVKDTMTSVKFEFCDADLEVAFRKSTCFIPILPIL